MQMRWRLLLALAAVALALAACSREPPPGDRARLATAGARESAPSTALPEAQPSHPPADPGTPAAAPMGENAGNLPEPPSAPQVYVVQPGDTLSAIAARLGCSVEALAQANGLANPNALQVGQQLQVPATPLEVGPANRLLPDSEFVYGQSTLHFDVTAFVARQDGYLSNYVETVEGRLLTGAQIVETVALHYSLHPRLLLALVEFQSGWVTNPTPADVTYPLGSAAGTNQLLYRQLAWVANELNRGYYDWRGRGKEVITWADGSATRFDPSLNAATVGVQHLLSLLVPKAMWLVQVGTGPGSLLETYGRLFGSPNANDAGPLLPPDLAAPELVLPWDRGLTWFLTGGPHGGWGDGSAWAAIDFVSDEPGLGCAAARQWATAMAEGLVVRSEDGEVWLDLDGDGAVQTGWVLFYLHLAAEGRVQAGTWVQPGDRLGHPSCEGGFSTATHLHIARRYNGEWIAADGPLPLVLDGWQARSDGVEYDGSLVKGDQVRTACECTEPDFNGIRNR